jgi:hypothetical protein
MEFLARASPNLVVANRYALSGLSEFGVSEREFVARHDKRLLLVHSDGSPLPSTPLHFENGPSVSLLIPLLLFARPRRVFLFGADGGSNPSFSKRPYCGHSRACGSRWRDLLRQKSNTDCNSTISLTAACKARQS